MKPQPHPDKDAERRELARMHATLLAAVDTPHAREAVADGLLKEIQRREKPQK